MAQPIHGPGQLPRAEPGPLPEVPAVTYREYNSDARNGPAPDRVRHFLGGYHFNDIGGGGVPTPAALRDQTVTLSDFLSLIAELGLEDIQVTRCDLLHNLRK